MVGLNFASEQEAEKFYGAVMTKLNEKTRRQSKLIFFSGKKTNKVPMAKFLHVPITPHWKVLQS